MKIVSKCIVIDKRSGQSTLQKLNDAGLLDLKLKIFSKNEFLYIPIKNVENLPEILQNLDFKIQDEGFESRNLKPYSLKNSLLGKIPPDLLVHIPRSFDQIGDLIIIDIPKELSEFKSVIGQDLMHIYPTTMSVFNKTSRVDGEYRIRAVELISGSGETSTIHRENGIRLHVDISNSYFSPRLSFEHRRIMDLVTPGDKVLDMFAGIGPFSVLIAKNIESEITAVDINPYAVENLRKSIKLNRSYLGHVISVVVDANQLLEKFDPNSKFDKIIMNHPSGAINYLKTATMLLSDDGIIFCYVFAPKKSQQEYCKNLIAETVGERFTFKNVTQVRNYSAFDDHVCIAIEKSA